MTPGTPESFQAHQKNLSNLPRKSTPEPGRRLHTLNLLLRSGNPLWPTALFPRFFMGQRDATRMSQKSTRMSQKSRFVFGALAAAATFGAVQIAAGKAASTATLADRFLAVSEPAGAAGVNRSAKGDREAAPQASAAARTVQLRTDSLADTSVLIRIPVQKDARNLPPAQPAQPAKAKPKMTVACEPVVSVLTEVAKLLQPGRCVT